MSKENQSGAEAGQTARDNFDSWMATMDGDSYRQMINLQTGKLKRGDIVKAIGCDRGAFKANGSCGPKLKKLEDDLRDRGVLPALKAKADTDKPKEHDSTASRRILDSNKSAKLERENIELRAKIKELESKLACNQEWSDVMAEMGMMPR